MTFLRISRLALKSDVWPPAAGRRAIHKMRHNSAQACKCKDPDQSGRELRSDSTAIRLSDFTFFKNKWVSFRPLTAAQDGKVALCQNLNSTVKALISPKSTSRFLEREIHVDIEAHGVRVTTAEACKLTQWAHLWFVRSASPRY